jgi:hypothetical protein
VSNWLHDGHLLWKRFPHQEVIIQYVFLSLICILVVWKRSRRIWQARPSQPQSWFLQSNNNSYSRGILILNSWRAAYADSALCTEAASKSQHSLNKPRNHVPTMKKTLLRVCNFLRTKEGSVRRYPSWTVKVNGQFCKRTKMQQLLAPNVRNTINTPQEKL